MPAFFMTFFNCSDSRWRSAIDFGPKGGVGLAVLQFAWLTSMVFALSSAAHANIFHCKDANGRVINSDRPIAECQQREVKVLRSDASTAKVIPAPLTEEQRKQQAIEAEAAIIRASQLRKQKQRDQSLLAAYSSIEALEAARKRDVSDYEVEIAAARKRIVERFPDLLTAQSELKAIPQGSPTGAARHKVKLAASAILVEEELIQAKQTDITRVNEKYDQDAKRLRELLQELKVAQAKH